MQKSKILLYCKKCRSQLIEEVDGFLLGFLTCPRCKKVPDKIIKSRHQVKK